MANKQLINGKAYDWSSVTITASGMENMEPMEISYDDEEEKEPILSLIHISEPTRH